MQVKEDVEYKWADKITEWDCQNETNQVVFLVEILLVSMFSADNDSMSMSTSKAKFVWGGGDNQITCLTFLNLP